MSILRNFTPELVEELSNKWGIPTNSVFISSLGGKFSYRIDELDGVRLILYGIIIKIEIRTSA